MVKEKKRILLEKIKVRNSERGIFVPKDENWINNKKLLWRKYRDIGETENMSEKDKEEKMKNAIMSTIPIRKPRNSSPVVPIVPKMRESRLSTLDTYRGTGAKPKMKKSKMDLNSIGYEGIRDLEMVESKSTDKLDFLSPTLNGNMKVANCNKKN